MQRSQLLKKTVFGAVMMACLGLAQAGVKVEDAWVRATVPNQQATGAFMHITSSDAARVVGGSSPLGKVELHEMAMDGDVMRMRQIPGLDLPAGQSVELKPGGYHFMLLDLKQQVKAGEHVPFTLEVEKAGGARESIALEVPVRALNATHGGDAGAHGAKGGHGH